MAKFGVGNPFTGGEAAFTGGKPSTSRSQQEAKIAALESEITGKGFKERDAKYSARVKIEKFILARIIRVERARMRAQGRFESGLGMRLPGANDDGPDIAGGSIIGNASGRRGANLPFSAALINGLF